MTFFFLWHCGPARAMASSFLRFLDHTQRRITVGRTPLDEWSARRTDLYLTTHSTHNRQTSMPLVGFEPTISAGERPQTYALDRAVTGTGLWWPVPPKSAVGVRIVYSWSTFLEKLAVCWYDILGLLWTPTADYCVKLIPACNPVPDETHNLSAYFSFSILLYYYSIYHPLTGSFNRSLPSKIVFIHLSFVTYALRPIYHSLLDSFSLILFDEGNKLWSLLCSYIFCHLLLFSSRNFFSTRDREYVFLHGFAPK